MLDLDILQDFDFIVTGSIRVLQTCLVFFAASVF